MSLRDFMRRYLSILGFLALVAAAFAGNPGDEVVVIYNTRVPESKGVAEYYAAKRNVPAGQVFGFPLNTTESMSREEYQDRLEKPLARELETKKLWHIAADIIHGTNSQGTKVLWLVKESKIRYAVLCYGVPLRITEDPNLKEKIGPDLRPELRRNGAAVDSELSLLPWIQQNPPLTGPQFNQCYTLTNANLLSPTNGLLMVTRLDGPNATIARGLVDKAMEAETNGLCGRAYIDARGLATNSPLNIGEQWILGAGKICKYFGGFDTTIDTNESTFPADFPMSQIGIYCGWYSPNANGPFAQNEVEFMPGAFAYHLHSFSAHTLHSATENWLGPLLAKGVTATMGSVDEPYISGTPDVSVFCARWIVSGFTFGEAAYDCQETLSWQTTVVGDPLYRPFGTDLQSLIEEQRRTHNPSLEWSCLRAVNINMARGKRPAEIVPVLNSLPVTTNSSVLNEKIGDIFSDQGMPSSAVESYQTALKLNTSPLQRVRIRLDLADKFIELKQIKEARADLQELLGENPNYPGKAAVEKRIADLSNSNNEAATTNP